MSDSIILTSSLNTMTPIIKVVGNFCNCRCRYCFYHDEDQSMFHVMNIDLLEKFIKQYMEIFSGRLSFIWHGGEPLLSGIDFFRKIVDFQFKNLKDGQTIQNHIQTNAILMNDKWAEFFKNNNFKVGVSLDGDEKSHNRFRRDKSGKGTFSRVVRGIEVLRRHGIEPGIMKTLTSDTMRYVEDDFNFFLNTLKIKGWSVNVYLDWEKTNTDMIDQSIDTQKWASFLISYIDLWLSRDDSSLKIREIENFIAGVFGKIALNCTFNGSCTGYFCLDYNGKIYPCDRLSSCSDFLLGDLSCHSLLEILNSSRRLRYAETVNSLPDECIVCEWQRACHNGCASHRIGGMGGKYFYCEARKRVFKYLKERIGYLKSDISENQRCLTVSG